MKNNIFFNSNTNSKKNQKIFIFIYISICVFFVFFSYPHTYAGKKGLYNLLVFITSYHAFIVINLLCIVKIFTDKKFKKNTKIIINTIIVIIYLLIAPCIFLIKYVPSNYNSYIGNTFVIINNSISDIMLGETYDIKATTCTFETESIHWPNRGKTTNAKSSYVRFDNSFNIPVSPKDKIVIELLFDSNKTNIVTLYKKSGFIKSINGTSVNISYQEYLKIKENKNKESIDKLIITKIENKPNDLFQIYIGLNGNVTRSTWEYEKNIELFWLIKKDDKEIQRLRANSLNYTFSNIENIKSKYTISLIGLYKEKEYQLSKEKKLFFISSE